MSSRNYENHPPAVPGKRPDSPAIVDEDTYMPPSLARFYLTHLTATLIHYQGFTSCQAGVIAELERKVEDHIANIYGTARLLAEHCGRRDPQSGDIVSALEVVKTESLPVTYPDYGDAAGSTTKQEANAMEVDDDAQRKSGTSRSRRERKARRRDLLLSEDLIRFIQRDNRRRQSLLPDGSAISGIPSLPLVTSYPPTTTSEPMTLTISDSEDAAHPAGSAGASAVSQNIKVDKKKRKLAYMLDVGTSLPDLPPRHTWKRSSSEPPKEKSNIHTSSASNQQSASRLSTSALAYLASTLSTSSNMPPELSLVNHRLSGTSVPAPSPYSNTDVPANEGIPGPLVQMDYTSSGLLRMDIGGYASDSRLGGSSRSRKHGGRGSLGGDQRGRKLKFVVPGLEKRQPNPKVSAM